MMTLTWDNVQGHKDGEGGDNASSATEAASWGLS